MSVGVVVAILGLGLIIFIHELGHFVAGKLLRLKITEFFIGLPIGRPLFSFRRGQTEYGIKPVLFGGYIKFPEYVAMGEPQIDRVRPDGPAEIAGLKEEDIITSIDGQAVGDWHDIFQLVSTRAGKTVDLQANRGGVEIELKITLEDVEGVGRLGAGPVATDDIYIDDLPDTLDGQSLPRKSFVVAAGPLMNIFLAIVILAGALMIGFAEPTTTVGRVMSDSPAKSAGIEAGDKIVSVAGAKTDDWQSVIKSISDHAGQSVKIAVERDGVLETFSLTLRKQSDEGLLGIGTKLVRRPRPPVTAVKESFMFSYQATGIILDVMGRLVMRPTSVVGQLRSPIGVVQETAPIAERDLLEFAVTLAGISIAIGIFNLLPIPPLDGGRILVSLIEFLSRRRIKKESLVFVNAVGVSLLLMLMTYVIVADIFRITITK